MHLLFPQYSQFKNFLPIEKRNYKFFYVQYHSVFPKLLSLPEYDIICMAALTIQDCSEISMLFTL